MESENPSFSCFIHCLCEIKLLVICILPIYSYRELQHTRNMQNNQHIKSVKFFTIPESLRKITQYFWSLKYLRNPNWMISNSFCITIFPWREVVTHFEAFVPRCSLFSNKNKLTYGGYVEGALIINSKGMNSRTTFDNNSDSRSKEPNVVF